MKEPKALRLRKAAKLPEADIAGLASAMHASIALAQASGVGLPPTLAQKFFALLEAELEKVVPLAPPAHFEEMAEA